MFYRCLQLLSVLVLAACTPQASRDTAPMNTQTLAACSVDERGLVRKPPESVRFASFNVALFRSAEGELLADLERPDDQLGPGGSDAQVNAVAEILQRVRPDVLLLNEFDFDSRGEALARFQDLFLGRSQNGFEPLRYAASFVAPSNTGIQSGLDLDGDGQLGGPLDAFGYGVFPGQYAMAVLSRFPIDAAGARTFQRFRWLDMPDPQLPEDYFSEAAAEHLRLSSKSHWDLPLKIDGQIVHVLAAHPTPPGFDGPEDRNGRRNFDEIRLWADYLGGEGTDGSYLYDDDGVRGGLDPAAAFVILGDYNADPADGGSRPGAIAQLLEHPRVNATLLPTSVGGFQESALEGQANTAQRGDPAADTSDFGADGVGNLRIDYALPSNSGLKPRCAGVYWPATGEAGRELVGDGEPIVSSDHRLVWIDVEVLR